MKFASLSLLSAFMALVPVAQAESPPLAHVEKSEVAANSVDWPHQRSDIKPDARVTWGKLDNGLRYAILPTKTEPTRGSLRMLVLAGSGMEAADQQGMAHFLEHMAFNGTKRFAAGETFEYFQRLGMAFGAHTNAATQIDHTVYQLELPRTNEALTTDGLRLFRDFLDGMLLDGAEIERERGVVLSELTARNTAGYRSAVGLLKSALAGTTYSDRLPLGTIATVRAMKRERFVDFYETWYTPGRTVIVAVGDFDVAMVEAAIRSQFDDAKARRGETEYADVGAVAPTAVLTSRYLHVADASGTTVSLSRVAPQLREVDDLAHQRTEAIDVLINHIIDERLDKISERENSPIQAATFDMETLYNLVDRNHFSAQCKPQQWRATVRLLEIELRRALQHGFTAAEFSEAKSQLIGMLQAYAEQAATRSPSDLADELVTSLNERTVFADESLIKILLADAIANLTKADCERRLLERWRADELEVSVSGNVALEGDAERQILAAFHASAREPVEPPVDAAAKDFAYTDFGPAGEVTSRNVHDDLAVVQAVFANNVRVNIKPTPFEKYQIRVLVRFGGGLLELPSDKPGLQHFATSSFIAGGLKGLPLNELNRQIGGKNVGVVFAVNDDAFELRGACATPSLKLQLQLCAAFLTAPGFRTETERQFFDQMESIYAQRTQTLEGMMRYDGFAHLRSDDPRYVLPSKESLSQLRLADVQNWLAEPLRRGYLEITLVGDLDTEQALQYLATTFGALPTRDAVKPDFAAARRMTFPAASQTKEFVCDCDTQRAAAIVCWPVAGTADLPRCRRVYVLQKVLADRLRLKVREELGATYTPSVAYYSADAFPDYGYIAAQLLVEPAQVAAIGKLTTDVAAELAAGPISDDEFQRALQPVLSNIEPQRRDNGYWISSICDSQERARALEEIRTMPTGYASITKAELEQLAREYLGAGRAATLNIAPKSTSKDAMAAK